MSANFSVGIVEVGNFRFPCTVSAFNNLRRNFEETKNLGYWISIAIKQCRDDEKLSHNAINTVNHLDGVLFLTGTNVLFKLPCSTESYQKLIEIFYGLAARSAPWHEFAFVLNCFDIDKNDALAEVQLSSSDKLNKFLGAYTETAMESVISVEKRDCGSILHLIARRSDMEKFKKNLVSVAVEMLSKKQFENRVPGRLLNLRDQDDMRFAMFTADTISVNNGHLWWM